MLSSDYAQPVLSLAPLNTVLMAVQSVMASLGLSTLVEQGRSVPWGGVLTVVVTGMQGLLV